VSTQSIGNSKQGYRAKGVIVLLHPARIFIDRPDPGNGTAADTKGAFLHRGFSFRHSGNYREVFFGNFRAIWEQGAGFTRLV
jgi:hypothetical protein